MNKNLIMSIRDSISLSEFLDKSHGNSSFICPKCGSGTGPNKTGALKTYTDTKLFYCHKCGFKGDVIELYMFINNCDFMTAIEELAARIGKPVTRRIESGRQKTETNDFRAYYEWCRSNLNAPEAAGYLLKRGITIGTARRAGIGFDPKADPANAPGALTDENKRHPAPRIIAPCTNGFYIARSINPETPAAYKSPNPRGAHTRIFNEHDLYSGSEAVFIAEGLFDALSFLEAGQKAVALNGKQNGKLLLQQLQLIPADTAFVICPDNDIKPENAADTMKRAEELNNSLHKAGYKSIVYNVAGDYHDANDALKKDRAGFLDRISAALKQLRRDDLDAFLENVQGGAYARKETGTDFLDRLTGGGIIPQSLILLLAAPAAGKTTLCAQIAETLAERGQPVIYFNMEMSKEQMFSKAFSSRLTRAGYDMTAQEVLEGHMWTEETRRRVMRISEEYRKTVFPYLKYDQDTGSDYKALLKRLETAGKKAVQEERPAPAAVVDYLHLLRSRDGSDSTETIKAALEGLKRYAVRFNTFVFVISAVNRDSMLSGNVNMFSGRDTSGIEYDADYLFTLKHKKSKQPADSSGGRIMILTAEKNRFSVPGKSVAVIFDGAHNIFYSAGPRADSEKWTTV